MGMIKQMFGNRPTSKMDVYLAAGAAAMAVIHFFSVKSQYKSEQEQKEIEA